MVRMGINVASREIYHSPIYLDMLESADEAYLNYRRQWHLNPPSNTVNAFPLHVSFESTNNCNLRCIFCTRTTKDAKGQLGPTKIMEFGLFKKVIEEGSPKGLKAIKLNTGDTEPLLVPDVAERIAFAKGAGLLDVMINTNGTLLTEKRAHEILHSGLDKLFISFDAPDKETYEKIRVGANYERVVENIFRFCEMKKNSGRPKPFVGIQMVKMKHTANLIQKFINMFKDHVDIIKIGDYNNQQNLNKMDLWVSRVDSPAEFACSQLWQRLQIRVDGKVIPCCGDVNNELVLGNANDTDIEELWSGDELQRLRRLHLAGRWKEIGTCRRCGLPRINTGGGI